jgi:hypothetical protein
MFDGIAFRGSSVVVRFKRKTWAKASWDGSAEIGSGGDAHSLALEEGVEVLLTRSDGHSEDLDAV